MPIDLYYTPGSSQCQAIQMTAAALGVELTLKPVALHLREHLKPEFVALNPQHTIPTLVDGEFVLWETRAILTYLVDKYGKPAGDSALYPREVHRRATIDQRLYFDMGTLYSTFGSTLFAAIRAKKTVDEAGLEKCHSAFGHLDTFLKGADFVAGAELTVADLALFATVSLYELAEFDFAKFENVTRWYGKMRAEAPGREINEAGMAFARQHFAKLK